MDDRNKPPISHRMTHQALLIPEILEAILLQLPLVDLLVTAQLVSHSWHSAITQSAQLQRALFFDGEPAQESRKPTFNPLLQGPFGPWFDAEESRYRRGKVFTDLAWNGSNAKREAFMRKEASWRRMLPIQPPVCTFEVRKVTSARSGESVCKGRVDFPEGVRMGTLYDYAYVSVARPISSFSMRWHRPLENKCDEDDESDEHTGEESHTNEERNVVVMSVRWTRQCSLGMPPDVGAEFRSAGFEELSIPFGDST